MSMVTVLLTGPLVARAQSDRDLGISDAMLVAPAVAFVPGILTQSPTVTLRYGGWTYHASEPVRSNVAATFSDSIRFGTVAASLGYLSPACKGCDAWGVSSAELERSLSRLMRLRLGVGLGRTTQRGGSSASVTLSLPFVWQGEGVALLINPAAVFAGVETERSASRGLRPALGAALQFHGSRLMGHAGLQGMLLRGTGLTFGGGIGWRL